MADISKEMVVQLAREVGATPYTNRHYPDRPTHTFNVEQLEAFVNKIAKLARNQALEEAKQACTVAAKDWADVGGDMSMAKVYATEYLT